MSRNLQLNAFSHFLITNEETYTNLQQPPQAQRGFTISSICRVQPGDPCTWKAVYKISPLKNVFLLFFFLFFKEDSLTLSRVLEFIFNVFYAVSQFRVFHYTKRLLKSYEFGMFSSICCLKTPSAIQSHLCGGAEWEMQMLPQSNGSLHVC